MIFFALTYLIAWSTLPFGSFLAFSPLVSAIVVVLIAEGLPGLARLGRRVIRWRVNWIWYAAAIGLPLLVHAVAIGLNMAAGAPAPSLDPVPAVVRGAVGLWPRGWSIPPRGPWERSRAGAASPSLGCNRGGHPWRQRPCSELLITGWHLPLVFMPQFDLSLPDIATTVVVTFWYAWLFNRTGGSVLLTLIAHATEGSCQHQGLWPPGADADRAAWTWLIAWALLVVALLIFDRKSWRTAPESAIDRVPGRIS